MAHCKEHSYLPESDRCACNPPDGVRGRIREFPHVPVVRDERGQLWAELSIDGRWSPLRADTWHASFIADGRQAACSAR